MAWMATWLIVSTLALGAHALRLQSSETVADVSLHAEDTVSGLMTLRAYLEAKNEGPKLKQIPDGWTAEEHKCLESAPVAYTMKSANKFVTLLSLAQKASKVEGDIMLAGVAGGGDVYGVMYYLACTGNLEGREVHVFDTWEGLPAAAVEEDAGFAQGAYHVAWENFVNNGVAYGKVYDALPDKKMTWADAMKHMHTYKGLFADTMPAVGKKVALLSCDGDMYQSTMDCLKSAEEKVVSGGPIYQDDYYTFSGNYKAVQDYRTEKGIKIESAPMYLVKQGGDVTPMAEHLENCNPPVDNSPSAGTCQGAASEGGFWVKA